MRLTLPNSRPSLRCLVLLATASAFIAPASANASCAVTAKLTAPTHLVTTVDQPTRAPAHRFEIVLPDTNARHDREYAPALHFSDGTVAVYSGLLAARLRDEHATDETACYVATGDAHVIGPGQTKLASTSQPALPGYVAFGQPRVIRRGEATFVVDRGLPAWAVEYIQNVTARAASAYANHLGKRALPLIMAYASPGKDPYLWGDHLEGSVTLGLYGDWHEGNEAQRAKLRDFIDHELFHVWNGSAIDRSDSAALLGLEGGADLARVLLEFERTHDTSAALNEASDALARCQVAQYPPDTLRAMLQNPQPGKIPYDCGMALLFVLTVRPAGNTLDDSAFWQLWEHHAIDDASREKYTWASIIRAEKTPVSALVDHALDANDFATAAAEAARSAGYRTDERKSLSANLASMVGGRLMASIMASDCHGRVGFYFTPDGYQLDDATPACDNLKPKMTVLDIAGIKPSFDPLGLSAKLKAQCAANQPITVTYVGSDERSRIACPSMSGSFTFFALTTASQ